MVKTLDKQTIGILGAGAAGTAYGQLLALSGHTVLAWDTDAEIRDDINKRHEQRKRFPGIMLSPNLVAVATAEEVLAKCKVVIIGIPAHLQTEVAAVVSPYLTKKHILVHASAGVRPSDGALLTEVWAEAVPHPLTQAVIAGPNFAIEMMQGLFTALVVAAEKMSTAETVGKLFTVKYIRPYFSDDMVGVQVAGAMKNVLSIAAGMVDGMGDAANVGTNARAALLCRGLVEMTRLATAMGGKAETMMGLAGMGDVLLHATSTLSRNYRFGVLVGRGISVEEAAERVAYVEGIHTARMVAYLAASNGLDLAIVSAVDGILNGDVTPERAYEILLTRPPHAEFEGV
ncbi:MAG: NAD(P)H-dependent glycerol-3-phosphate dehydrogenase [Alphaproteobacteria bacterium]